MEFRLTNFDCFLSTISFRADLYFIDIMAARKTIVFLVGYLLIGWVVWIIVNFI